MGKRVNCEERTKRSAYQSLGREAGKRTYWKDKERRIPQCVKERKHPTSLGRRKER